MQTELVVLIFFCCRLSGKEASCDEQLVYKMTNIECVGNPERVKNISCNLKAVNWTRAIANMDCYLPVPLYNPVLFKRDYSNQWKPFLVDVSVNVGDVISRRSFLPYGVIMWKMLQRFTNVNHSFPISGHLFARNGYLDPSLVPPFPLGLYQVSAVIVDRNSGISEYVGTVKFYLQSMLPVKNKKRPRPKAQES
ncbi:GL20304 [Drosophila persimilis]|uniref:GL20304 n=1 Tax=Drosophila persimilis TaxID=7234 RepID=B4H647_DROPE|nr:GL20304 [Drosophila persimilis]